MGRLTDVETALVAWGETALYRRFGGVERFEEREKRTRWRGMPRIPDSGRLVGDAT